MKALIFTDLHGDLALLEKLKKQSEEVDYVIFAGDLTWFSEGLEIILARLNEFSAPVILVHGNHESKEEMQMLCDEFDNLYFISNASLRNDNYVFLGYGDGGFSVHDEGFKKLAELFERDIHKDDKIILVCHAPPYGTKTDLLYGEHSGIKEATEFIKRHNVILCITGHFHECEGREDKIKQCRVINPGRKGKIIQI